MAVESSYTFDPNESVDARKRRRRIAEQLLAQGMDASPIQSPWQGAARMAQALMGGLELGMEDKKEREQTAAYNAHNSGVSSTILGGGGGAASPKLTMSPVTQALMPPDEVKAIIDAHVPEADREFAYRMAQKESNFNPSISSPTGAKGLFQFTQGTGKSYGLVDDSGDYRADPVRNTRAFVQLTNDNREGLRRVLGREPTPGELAVAHQQGLGGATALLTGRGTVNPRNLEVQAGNPKNAQDIMRYYGFAPDQGQGGPIQVAQANTGTMNDASGRVQQLYGIATNPMTSPVNKKLALDEIERLRKGSDPAAAVELENKRLQNQKLRREVEGEGAVPLTPEERAKFGVKEGQPAFRTRSGDIKFGPVGTTVNTNVSTAEPGDKEFFKKLDEGAAKRWETYKTRGDQAQSMIGDLTQLREISKVVGQQGAGVNVKAALGPYAEALGIDIGNLSDIQTFESIVQRLAPQLREPGSGSTSDIEFKGFLRSIGPLSNNPQARERIIDTFEAFARHDMARAEIATQLGNREISRSEAEKAIRALPDPLTAFRQFKKDNPDAFKGGAPAAAATGQKVRRYNPQTGRFEEVTQ